MTQTAFPTIRTAIAALLALCLPLAALAISVPSEPVEVSSAPPRPDPTLKQPASAEKSTPRPYAILLPPAAPETTRAADEPTAGRARRIGFGRAIPKSAQALDVDDRLAWQASADGGQFARVVVGAEGAKGIRFEIQVIALPARAELRFYSLRDGMPGKASWVATGREIHRVLNDKYRAHPRRAPDLGYWSPTLAGERGGMEIYLPPGIAPGKVRLAISRISQLTELPDARSSKAAGSSGFCQIDIACENGWQDTGSSVAQMVFIENGTPFDCTGTLINDRVNDSQRPLFLTAEHCIDSQEVAATLETIWFFQRDSCFSSGWNSGTKLSGGARLLSHGSASDYSLLELNDTPPVGARFAGWTTEPPARFSSVTLIHHPHGDLKKISFGLAEGNRFTLDNPDLDAPIQVSWTAGTSEGGSSGAPLFNRDRQLVGQLWGGRSSCANPSGTDFFGRFELTEKSIADELAGNGVGGDGGARLGTLASRGWIGSGGDQVMIAGVSIRGSGQARIVARGAGPTMGGAGLTDLLQDPELQLFDAARALIAENDDWGSTEDVQAIIDAGLALNNPLEAALVRTLDPGDYTVILRDKLGRAGIGGLALDDLELPDGIRLAAISTRAQIESGDKVLIAGFRIIGGEKTVVIRAFGPSLHDIPGAGLELNQLLQDPVLEVFSGSRKIGENDDWRATSAATLIQANGLAPGNDLESAIQMTLPPGSYTAVVRGLGGTTGIGGVAVNEVP